MSRVLHIVPALFGLDNIFGGAERYALELAREMSDHVPTTLVAFGRKFLHKKLNNLDIIVLKNWLNFKRFKFDPVNPFLIKNLLEADIIHYHQSNTMMASLALAYAHINKKTIFSTQLGGSGYGIHRITDVTDWYDGHLHISKFSCNAFNHSQNAKARVILGGVDTDKFSPDINVKRTNEVLYVGRLLPHKGINYLVEAVAPDEPLMLVGRPAKYAQDFYKLLQDLSLNKQVRFFENCNDDAVIQAYRQALCIVLPSVHSTVFGGHYSIPELLGQTLIEGMACGTPAIATDVTSLPEVIDDGVTGFIVPPNDPKSLAEKIKWLRQHPVEAKEMGQAARRRVLDLFTWEKVVERCLLAYQELGKANFN